MRPCTALLGLVLLGCPTAPPPALDAGVDAGPTPCPELFFSAPLLDFGCVARGDSFTLPGPDAGVVLGSSSGSFFVDGQSIRFAPTAVGQTTTSIQLLRGECVIGEQPVIGDGVDAPLSWEPALVDFGFVALTLTKTETVTLRSCAARPIALQNPVTREGTTPSTNFGFDAGVTTIPAATRDGGVLVPARLALTLGFSPTSLGPHQGTFVAATALPTQEMLSIPLRGMGGGPEIDVQPGSLAFGAITMTTTAMITVSNVGTRPNPPDPRGNLHLGLGGNLPYFDLTPGDCATVTLSTYDPSLGIDTFGSVTVTITLQPTGMPRVCTLHIFSDGGCCSATRA